MTNGSQLPSGIYSSWRMDPNYLNRKTIWFVDPIRHYEWSTTVDKIATTNYEQALANVYAAMGEGVNVNDSSIAGLRVSLWNGSFRKCRYGRCHGYASRNGDEYVITFREMRVVNITGKRTKYDVDSRRGFYIGSRYSNEGIRSHKNWQQYWGVYNDRNYSKGSNYASVLVPSLVEPQLSPHPSALHPHPLLFTSQMAIFQR